MQNDTKVIINFSDDGGKKRLNVNMHYFLNILATLKIPNLMEHVIFHFTSQLPGKTCSTIRFLGVSPPVYRNENDILPFPMFEPLPTLRQVPNYDKITNFQYCFDSVNNFGNYRSGYKPLDEAVSTCESVTYRSFLFLFRKKMVANLPNIEKLDAICRKYGDYGYCKVYDAKMPTTFSGKWNRNWIPVEPFERNYSESPYNEQFGFLFVQGNHKFLTLKKSLEDPGFCFCNKIALFGIKATQTNNVKEVLSNWFGEVLFSYGSYMNEKEPFAHSKLACFAEQYNIIDPEELTVTYDKIGKNLEISPLKNGKVVEYDDCKKHQANAELFINLPSKEAAVKNAVYTLRSQRVYSVTKTTFAQAFYKKFINTVLVLHKHYQQLSIEAALNVCNYLLYQRVVPSYFFKTLLCFLTNNQKGCNMFCLWGPNKSCGKSSLLSAISEFTGEDYVANLHFDDKMNQFWAAGVEGKLLCISDQVEDYNAVVFKEEAFDGILKVRTECKGKNPKTIAMPHLLITSNIRPPQTLLEERMMELYLNERIEANRFTNFMGFTVDSKTLVPLRGIDIHSFLYVGILLQTKLNGGLEGFNSTKLLELNNYYAFPGVQFESDELTNVQCRFQKFCNKNTIEVSFQNKKGRNVSQQNMAEASSQTYTWSNDGKKLQSCKVQLPLIVGDDGGEWLQYHLFKQLGFVTN